MQDNFSADHEILRTLWLRRDPDEMDPFRDRASRREDVRG